MKVVFLGDSFTSGEHNNDTSFCDYIENCTSYNLGVSGTTMGEYSIYPVDGNSLLSVIRRRVDLLAKADVICLEYGINDTSAIMCGFATEQMVLISLIKAIDWLKQINPSASILFLKLSNNSDTIQSFAEAQSKYLERDYFKGYNFTFPVTVWRSTYESLMKKIEPSVKVVPMFRDYDEYLVCADGLHPNNTGYKVIADELSQYI